ncbi:MAG: excinuclease ABC subunit UvrC [Sulfurimonas sp.]|nr:excinuclease ABC subunit UvrC [Sulfurimonas sp.]MBU3938257.1 excinuclease ABC subunit UvrC [bacterium]MBU4025419.1 excinuclease ABC subunit UvrC [bacterium]MBU4059399.1 excinuclease ABC subunit UvrC [bacterium]MBU4110711.1 excinuclease ABC subunit UvrC [bacterium]
MKLLNSIQQLPQSAGVYQYFDENNNLLYIGKAKNLSKRVRSYFSFTPSLQPSSKLGVRIHKMISQAHSLNYIVVNSEHDALILENSLIKQLNPKYNILLRDDKTYPYIFLDNSQKFPRFEITRKIIKAHDISYYGPYSIGARDILDSIYEVCKLVQKKSCLSSKKLCLYYQINKCLGPCELSISRERYNKELKLAGELIENKTMLTKLLSEKMNFYAEEMRFEEAAELRDRIQRIQKSEINSDIDFATLENYDIFAIEMSDKRAVVVRMFMRHGKIISSTHNFIQINDGFDEDELYQRALLDFYAHERPPIVAPILVSKKFEDLQLIQEHLSTLFEKNASIKVPLRGEKKQLIDLALLNAKELLKQDKNKKNEDNLEEIKELFSLQRTPSRVEVFDNSHMSGVATVGAMVVYENAAFDKKSYRIYHLQAKDEYGQMREMLTRRVESFSKNPPPDLWIVDGGATLLKLADDILSSYGVFVDLIGIAKEKVDAKAHRAKGKANDILHTRENLFKLKNSDKRLQWVQKLRDEAHRSAIAFHKKTKLKLDQESQLLSLHGISMAKIKKLLSHFGTFECVKKATLDDLSSVLNAKDANVIKKFYK